MSKLGAREPRPALLATFVYMIVLCLGVGAPSLVLAEPRLSWQLESQEIYADLPFTLALQAEGFEESPEPAAPDLSIPGARLTYLGVSPNVSSQLIIVNGRRSETRTVTFVYRWRVQAGKPGTYRVPAVTVDQGPRSARTRSAQFTAQDVESTKDMTVRLALPDRPVWVGETFDVEIEWLLSRDVENFEFVVPLFDLDHVQVQAPEPTDRTVDFAAGARQIALPLVRDDINRGGTRYARFRFPARITINKAGPIDLAPVRVAARLQSGTFRDRFGFRRTRSQLFKAEGKRERLVVKALPLAGRPTHFVNAIGSGFSIAVVASRTVVQVGDPIELKVQIRGDGPLEGLSLPPLESGFDKELFSIPASPETGRIDETTNTKTFDVTVRVRSDEVREIPPIEFAYFDPRTSEYATVSSRPIALSVSSADTISAADVTLSPEAALRSQNNPTPSSPTANTQGSSPAIASLIGADMALSRFDGELQSRVDSVGLAPLLWSLYAIPLLLAAMTLWMNQTRGTRHRDRAVTQSVEKVRKALASETPARDSAPAVLAGLRDLAAATGRNLTSLNSAAIERLQTSAYDPSAANHPIAQEIRDELSSLIEELREPKPAPLTPGNQRPASSAAMILLTATLAAASAFSPDADSRQAQTIHASSHARPRSVELDHTPKTPPLESTRAQVAGRVGDESNRAGSVGDPIAAARARYVEALEETDRIRRTRLFADAEQLFQSALAQHPGASSLLVDWGNAAIGAQNIGHAVLAYRRALRIDPGNERARKNLQWLRDRQPVWLPRPADDGALGMLLFWERAFSVADRFLIAAGAFAIAILLITPWPLTWTQTHRRTLLKLAALPAFLWFAATTSAWFDDTDTVGVVVTDGALLRSADSLGAPAAFANPLPSGTELNVLEERAAWFRVVLADGSRGWLRSSAVGRLVTPK